MCAAAACAAAGSGHVFLVFLVCASISIHTLRTLHPKVYPVQAGGGFNVYWQTPLSEATKLQGICVENEAMYRPVRPNLLMGRGWPMLAGVGAAWGDRGLS
jgi:hypothetical protein